MTRLGSCTSPDVAAAPPRVLVIALGSTEQHGPHLPLDTDVRIAESIAHRVADASDRFISGPTVPIGAAGEHAGFAGTLSIGTDVVAELIIELRRSMGAEFEALAVVNAHGGNVDALERAGSACASERRELRTWTVRLPGADAHAGRTETSLMLAIAPETVRLERAEAGPSAPLSGMMSRLREGGVGSVSPNGVLGDPTGASAEEGRRLLDALVADAVATLSVSPPAGG